MFFRRRRDAGAVHKDDLPVACLFFQKGRFQPILLRATRSVRDATFIDICDPGGVAADVHVGLGHIPLVMLARSMLSLDEGHDGVAVESGTAIENVKIRGNDGIELRGIVGAGGREDRTHCVYDLLLLGFSIYISGEQRHDG